MGKLDGNVAVVTDGSSGIGRATAIALGLDADEEGVKHSEYLPQAGVERVLQEHPGIFLSAVDAANAVLYTVKQPRSVLVD